MRRVLQRLYRAVIATPLEGSELREAMKAAERGARDHALMPLDVSEFEAVPKHETAASAHSQGCLSLPKIGQCWMRSSSIGQRSPGRPSRKSSRTTRSRSTSRRSTAIVAAIASAISHERLASSRKPRGTRRPKPPPAINSARSPPNVTSCNVGSRSLDGSSPTTSSRLRGWRPKRSAPSTTQPRRCS